MEYEKRIRVPSFEKFLKHFVASCVKCNCDDIQIDEYEDQFGFISTATCKNKTCKNSVKVNADDVSVIKVWNKQNDIATLIMDKTKLIEDTKAEIKQLKLLHKSRRIKP